MRLVKDGKILLDGTLREYEKEKLVFEKIEKIEDIEEELGIDLDTLFKALKNGIWVKYSSAIIEHKTWYVHLTGHYIGWKENSGSLYDNDRVENRPLKDYGKTWSLNKEDLL